MARVLHICLLIIGFFSATIPRAFAHVGYVLEENDFNAAQGLDWGYFFSPLHSPTNLLLIAVTTIAIVVIVGICMNSKSLHRFRLRCRARAAGYHDLVPWMLRLSIGIALLGAGTARVLISPALTEMHVFALAQTLIGFLLLAGVATGAATLAALLMYAIGVFTSGYLFGSLDFAALCIALLLYGESRPGVDHIAGIRFFPGFSHLKRFVPLVLRIGVGGAMVFLAVYEKMLNPHTSAMVVEQFGLNTVIPVDVSLWVFGAGVIELILGLCLMLGVWTRPVSLVTFFVLSLSFFYFGEDVYSHVTLFGSLSVLIALGAGHWSLDEWLHKKGIEKGAFI